WRRTSGGRRTFPPNGTSPPAPRLRRLGAVGLDRHSCRRQHHRKRRAPPGDRRASVFLLLHRHLAFGDFLHGDGEWLTGEGMDLGRHILADSATQLVEIGVDLPGPAGGNDYGGESVADLVDYLFDFHGWHEGSVLFERWNTQTTGAAAFRAAPVGSSANFDFDTATPGGCRLRDPQVEYPIFEMRIHAVRLHLSGKQQAIVELTCLACASTQNPNPFPFLAF